MRWACFGAGFLAGAACALLFLWLVVESAWQRLFLSFL